LCRSRAEAYRLVPCASNSLGVGHATFCHADTRYSSYSATNFRSTSAQIYLDPLEVQYRELLELRERVR
jgi:hypothetical protein